MAAATPLYLVGSDQKPPIMSPTDPPPDGQQTAPPPDPEADTAVKFLEFVFGGTSVGYVEFRYFTAGARPKKAARPTYIELPPDYRRIVDEVLASRKEQAIAFGPAPRFRVPPRAGQAKDQDVLHVGCVWANLDYRSVEGGAVDIVRRVRDFPLRPSVAVSSGYGHHVYFVFHAPLRPEKLVEWSDLMGGLRRALRISDKTNLSQVMRLPGTLNLKHERPVRCEIWEEHSSWARYDIDEVRRAVEQACVAAEGSSLGGDEARGSHGPAREHLTVEALRGRGVDTELLEAIITGRVGARMGGAHGADTGRDFYVAARLHALGLGREEIKGVFRAHPGGCGRTWAKKRDGEKYLESTLHKVERRAGDSGLGWTGWAEDEADEGSWLPPGYVQTEDGSVWYHPPVTDESKAAAKPVRISNSLIRITEIRENIDTGQITLSISFEYLGRSRTTQILRSHMSNSRQLVSALAGEGAPVTSNNARHVLAYLEAYEHEFAASITRKKVTSRLGRGRADGPFFLPGLIPAVEFAPLGPGDASLIRAYSSRRGSLHGWAEVMRMLDSETLIIPQVAVVAALVPPLQRRLQIPNFILDLYGNTSTGKSTSLKLAASVYGRPHDPDSLVMQWMGTQSAIEQVAGMCSELPIFLDDAQHCPAELKRAVIYMIANGRGKVRSGGRARVLEVPTWNTVALSTSEEPLHESSPHEGARGRILSIGGTTPPFRPGSALMVQDLERAVANNHGHAGEAYVRHLNGLIESEWLRWHRRYSAVRMELLRGTSSNVAGRVSGYVAAVQVAAEIACPLLSLPFRPDVLAAWLMLHVGEQESDRNLVLVALRALADYYVANLAGFAGDGQYRGGGRTPLQGLAKKQQYVAFLRSTLDGVFRTHKWNPTALLNKMSEAGVLLTTEKQRHTKRVCYAGVNHRMVCFKWSAILPDDAPHTAPGDTLEQPVRT
jgi:hypothetical protein